jgi:hypothetical protein
VALRLTMTELALRTTMRCRSDRPGVLGPPARREPHGGPRVPGAGRAAVRLTVAFAQVVVRARAGVALVHDLVHTSASWSMVRCL